MLGQLSQSLTLFRVLYRWANATIPMLCRFIRTKENFHGYLDSNGRGPKRGKEVSENDACEETTEAPLEEPDVKKLKLGDGDKVVKPDGKRMRGQNKSRPHIKPNSYDKARLCTPVIQV